MSDAEEEDGGEGASLTNASKPTTGGGEVAVDLRSGLRVLENKLGLGDHSFRGSKGRHDGVEEVTVDGVKGFGDVEKEEGCRGVGEEKGRVEEGSEENVVGDLSVGEVGSLLRANAWLQGSGKALCKDFRKDPIEGGEEGNGAEGGGCGDGGGRGFGNR